MINSIHLKSYNPPAIEGVWILEPGKDGKRSIGISGVVDGALFVRIAFLLGLPKTLFFRAS